MNLFDQYGIKEVADVTLYSIHKKEDGSGDVYYLPALYLDTLKVSTTEQTADNVWATGGINNSRLINWDFGKIINVTLEDALCTPASLGLCWNGVLSSSWKDGKVVFNSEADNSVKRLSRMEKAKAPRQDVEKGTIGNLLPKVKSDIIDGYFGILKTSAVVDGTDIRGFGMVNNHTYKWKMVIESLVKSIAVVPDRFFDIYGKAYRIDWNRKVSVHSLPDYENYKDAIIYKINSSSHYHIPDIPKLIFDAGEDIPLETDEISFEYQTNIQGESLATLSQLINRDYNYKVYDNKLIGKVSYDEQSGEMSIDDIYISQEDLGTLLTEDDVTAKYKVHESQDVTIFVDTLEEDRVEEDKRTGYLAATVKIIYVNCNIPDSYAAPPGQYYDPIPYNVNYNDFNAVQTGDLVMFVPQGEPVNVSLNNFYKLFKINSDFESQGIPYTSPTVYRQIKELESVTIVTSNDNEQNAFNTTTTPIIISEIDYEQVKENVLSPFKFAINNPFNYYQKTIGAYKIIKGSELDKEIRGTGLSSDSGLIEESLNQYMWNHKVDMINNQANKEIIKQSEKTFSIDKAEYLAIVIDNHDNYIPLVGVVVNIDGTYGYTPEELYGEDEPPVGENTRQIVWFNPCPKVDVSQFKGLDLWLKFESLNEMIYFLITKYENDIVSIDAATITTPPDWGVNQKTSTVEKELADETEKVQGKLWSYLNPRTMKPYADDYWFHQGEPYYIKSLTLAQGGKTISGNRIVVKADEWPGMYMMVGETWLRDRDSGKDKRLQIKIPLCKVRSDHTLTLQSDGEPTVFNLSLEVAEPRNGEIMEITAYDVRTRMEQDENGYFYAVDGSSEVIIE